MGQEKYRRFEDRATGLMAFEVPPPPKANPFVRAALALLGLVLLLLRLPLLLSAFALAVLYTALVSIVATSIPPPPSLTEEGPSPCVAPPVGALDARPPHARDAPLDGLLAHPRRVLQHRREEEEVLPPPHTPLPLLKHGGTPPCWPPLKHAGPGDVVVSNHLSYVEVLYFTFRLVFSRNAEALLASPTPPPSGRAGSPPSSSSPSRGSGLTQFS
jgi:hypothetical protein